MERLQPNDPNQIGPYQIINRLGSGGIGVVYLGTTGTRTAAVKIVRDFLLEDPTSRTRLAREVDALKKVKSPYVAEIVNSDVDSTPAWIATNYVDGPSLRTLITNEGVLSESAWLEFAFGLISAIHAVHKAGIIHRDVKPSNILMSATGPRLIDFGISFSKEATAITRTGMVAGTPSWFAPEQFQSNKISNAVDIFAAGSILYFAATGTSPWGDEDTSVAKTMNSIINSEPDLNKLTNTQRRLVEPMLVKNPKDRFSAEKLLNLIQEIKESTGIQFSQKSKNSRGPRKVVAAAVALTLVGAGTLSYLHFSKPDSRTSTPVKKVIYWNIQFDGDLKAQSGKGNIYSAFVCDQGVISDSLQIRELTLPVGKNKPTVKIVTGDARCGKDFDTLVVTGDLNTDSKKHDYVLAGSTKTGFLLNYNFSITKEVK